MSLERPGAMSLNQQNQELSYRENSELFKFPGADRFADGLWQVFLDTHPEFTEIIERNHGLEIREPLMTLEQALESSRVVRYEDGDFALSEIAKSMCARGNQSAKLAATVSYNVWLEANRNDASVVAAPKQEQDQQSEDFDLAA